MRARMLFLASAEVASEELQDRLHMQHLSINGVRVVALGEEVEIGGNAAVPQRLHPGCDPKIWHRGSISPAITSTGAFALSTYVFGWRCRYLSGSSSGIPP